MAVVYKVTIEPAGKENRFLIKWYNLETVTVDSFEQSAHEMMADEMDHLWHQSRHQLEIGRKLFRFLDGDSRYLQRALDEASKQGESLLLHLCACHETADWPFELLAQEETFLLPHRLHLVRYMSDWGKEKKLSAKNHPLKLLFMACSAVDVKPELDYEREEEAIFRVTDELALDMDVEDSGSLEGLRSRLVQEQYDVVHLSGHADIDVNGQPFFVMENETGYHRKISPEELWGEALIENPPRLLFLSGCRTSEAPDTGAAASFARILVENHNTPAVLGWGRSVGDEQAIHAEEMLYYELSRGRSVLEAVGRARYELAREYRSSTYPAWPLLRLFSSGIPLTAIVKKGRQPGSQTRKMVPIYLKNSRVRVLAEGFIGRRRQLQQGLRALKQDFNRVGLLILGTGGLGKSCLAGKICERFPEYTLITLHGELNGITLKAAMKDAFIAVQDKRGQQILSKKGKMADKLTELCPTSFRERRYLLLLDGFDRNLEGAERGQPGPLMGEAADLLKTLLHYLLFSDHMTRLIISCRYEFSLSRDGHDLVEERLEKLWLTGFQESEVRKKVRELENIANCPDQTRRLWLAAAGYGNPLLMERIDGLAEEIRTAETSRLRQAVQKKQNEFLHQYVIRELPGHGGDYLAHFLQRFAIFRRPVQEEGARLVAEETGIEEWQDLLKRGRGLSLIEYDRARQAYRLTPLLREQLLSKIKDTRSGHRAAFAYYKQICAADESFNPFHVEEWIYHALGCGEEKTAARQGGRLVKYLRERLAFRESLRVGQWILAQKERELTGEDEDDAFLLNETASTLNSLGEYERAVTCYQRALSIYRNVYGEIHTETVTLLNNLGTAWRASGKPEKAIEYYEQALYIIDKKPEERDPDWMGTLLNNLGSSRYDMGDYPQAVELYEKALAAWKKKYGESHWHVADTLNNLGSAWNDSGHHEKAIEYYRQALSLYRNVYGEIHPQTAAVLNNLGTAWYHKEEYNKAIGYYERALTIWENLYGESHPHVAAALNKLGQSWNMLDRPGAAVDFLQPALAIARAAFGDKHPDTAAVLENLGTSWRLSGEYEKALDFYQQALAINQLATGKNHPGVASNLANLGKTYYALDQKETARGYFEEAYAIFKELLGTEHGNTKAAAGWLAKVRGESE